MLAVAPFLAKLSPRRKALEVSTSFFRRLYRFFGNGISGSPLRASVAPDPQPVRDATRRELVGMAVRDVLRANGLYQESIEAETLNSSARNRTEKGIHLRLVLKTWDLRMLPYLQSIQQLVHARVCRLDPLASHWLTGISWRFAPEGDATLPALPPPSFWSRAEAAGRNAAVQPASKRASDFRAWFDQSYNDAPVARAAPADFEPTMPLQLRSQAPKKGA